MSQLPRGFNPRARQKPRPTQSAALSAHRQMFQSSSATKAAPDAGTRRGFGFAKLFQSSSATKAAPDVISRKS